MFSSKLFFADVSSFPNIDGSHMATMGFYEKKMKKH